MMATATIDSLVKSGKLGLAVIGVAIVLLCLAQALELRQQKGTSVKVASLVAVLACVVVAAMVVGRIAVLGG